MVTAVHWRRTGAGSIHAVGPIINNTPVTLYRIVFRSGLIFTPMGKIAVFTLRRCAPCHPAFFCIAISNASKFRSEILRNLTLAPEVLAYCTGAYRIC